MYKCSKCNLGVLVVGLEKPIRFCNCTTKTERKPITLIEKFKSAFGKKFYIEKPASIIVDMSCEIECKSKMSL